MKELPHNSPTYAAIHARALALRSLCDHIEKHGLHTLDQERAESIPAILSSATSALASARSADLNSPLVSTLETELFRCSELLRQAQRPRLLPLATHLLHTLPQHLFKGLPLQLIALLFIVCGMALGYRTTAHDALRILNFFPDGWSGVNLAEQLPMFTQAHMVQMWRDAPAADFATLLISFDVHLSAFFIGFVAAALLFVGLGGVFTPLLLLAFGGAFGAFFGLLPHTEVPPTWWRLFPMFSMYCMALMLAQSAGWNVLQSILPAPEGRQERHRAKHLQRALVTAAVGVLHMLLGVGCTLVIARSTVPERSTAILAFLAIVWLVLYALYIGVMGNAHRMFSRWDLLWLRIHTTSVPYAHPAPPVHKNTLMLHLREGSNLRVKLASFSERLGAFVIDSFVLLLWLAVVSILFSRFITYTDGFTARHAALIFATLLFPAIAYVFVTEWRWQGQTLGKRIFEIRTIRLDGERLDAWTMALRSMMLSVETIFPILLIFLSYIAAQQLFWILIGLGFLLLTSLHLYPVFNVYRQRIGDRMTGTITIVIPDTAEGFLAPPATTYHGTMQLPERTLTAYQRDVLAALRTRAERGDDADARAWVAIVLKTHRYAEVSNAELLDILDALYAQTPPDQPS